LQISVADTDPNPDGDPPETKINEPPDLDPLVTGNNTDPDPFIMTK
jgi:hypothetical protein